jgi:hypothetical protein
MITEVVSDPVQNQARLVDAALAYARKGWPVLPLHSVSNGACTCRRSCASPAKHPRTRHGLKDASTDPEIIEGWWSRWTNANVGVLTGPESGIVVLDVDPRHGGHNSLAGLLLSKGRRLPHTVVQQTGSGGQHILYKHPGGQIKNSAGRLGAGLDIKADNGYIVAAPSRHISGGYYYWVCSPDDVALQEMPQWLLELVVHQPNSPQLHHATTDRITAGSRNDHLTSLAGSLRRNGSSRAVIETALLEENGKACDPPLADDEVRRIAESVARYGTAPLHVWRDLIRSEHGPDSPTTRLVLLNLSLYMGAEGGNCYPSIRRQAKETRLSRKTIQRHLQQAGEAEWLYIYDRAPSTNGWASHGYLARIPDLLQLDTGRSP